MKHLLIFSISIMLLSSWIIGGEWERVALEGIEVTAIDIKTSNNFTEIIVGTNGEGIYKYDDQNSTITPFYTSYLDSFELFMRNINSVYIGLNCFTGTDSGLYYYFISDCLTCDYDYDSSGWERIYDIPAEPVTAITGRDDTIFAATRGEIYRSSNGGYQWEALNADSALPEMQRIPYFTSLTLNEYGKMSIYAGSMSIISISPWSGVLISLNMGETWAVHNGGLIPPAISVYSLCFYKEIFSDTIGYYACGTDKGVFTYRPMALSWTRLKPGILDSHKVNDLFVTTYSNSDIPELFACTDSGAYLLSGFPDTPFDQAKWLFLKFNRKTFCASALPHTGNYVKYWFVGTDDGLYKYHREEVSIKEENNYVKCYKKDATVTVCNNRINIRVKSELRDAITVYLVDSRGRIIKKIQSPTSHSIHTDTKGLSRGIYIVDVKLDEKSFTQKISLVK